VEDTGSPAFVHCGPFANIAHGCNSVMATAAALEYGDYAITEAGFGADLGAEKFYDIKCRKTGLQPDLTVLVVTLQALKMHGGVALEDIKKPNITGMEAGYWNLDKHVKNLQSFGQTVVIAFNKFATDTDEEIEVLRKHCEEMGCGFAVNSAFAEGGNGAIELANLVVKTIDERPSAPLYFAYDDNDSVEEKIEKVAFNLYGAGSVTMSDSAKAMIEEIKKLGAEKFPICIAKTQYSFSTDAKAYGPTEGFELHVRDITVNMGAEMVVVIAGPIMRMPGLPKSPQAERIDVVNGEITGLS
jgi:formate--tetrahydrofolate ligase